MKSTRRIRGGALIIGFIICCGSLSAHDTADEALKQIEPRMRAIYEEGAFRPQRFRAEWLPDSSGYVRREAKADGSGSERVRYDVETGNRSVLEPGDAVNASSNPRRSPNGTHEILTRSGGLQLRDLATGEVEPLTSTPTSEGVFNGRAVWSPDGRRIAWVQSDASMVKRRSVLVPGDPSYPEVRQTRFARVGGDIPRLRVGVMLDLDQESKETTWLPIPMPSEGCYLGQVSWAGNSDELLVEQLSRFRNARTFYLIQVATGEMTKIFHETDPAWVVASIGKNLGLDWIENGQAFIVLSEQDGWRHAYVCSRDGASRRLLTPGAFDIIEKVQVDEEGGWFYFNASPENATQKYLYRVALKGNHPPERVTPTDQSGTHQYAFSPDAKWAFHTYSTFDKPHVTDLVRLPEHRSVRMLEANRVLREKAAAMIKQPTEFLQVKIGEGVEMDAWMIKPPGFDPSKKYPVLVYVYGEPHAQTVLDTWGAVQSDYSRAVAELGYLVVSIDNRGTPAPKGAAWRRAVFGSLGPLSTEEQAEGLMELARMRPYVDASRVGIWGWSGGGSNTLNAMFRRPDVYHMGIAVAPKPQPHLYNAWFQEIYMETRETNPDGYHQAAAIHFAEGLEGDLLIVHGTGETNTHLQIVEGLVDRLVELGKPFDYMTYPNRDHGIREGKGTTLHMRMHMVRYLLNHLPPGPR